MTWHAVESQRVGPDTLLVTSHYGGVTRTTALTRALLEAMATGFRSPWGRPYAQWQAVTLDESEVLSLLAELGEPWPASAN